MSSTKSFVSLVIGILLLTSVVYAKENFQDKLERLFGIDMTEKISPPVPNSVTAQAVAVTKDTMPPVVGIMHWPSAPREGDTVKLTAVAYDVSGIARLILYVDDRSVKVCFTTTCTFDKIFDMGHHTYSVVAVDRKGNVGELPVDYTFDVLTTDGYLWSNKNSETDAGIPGGNILGIAPTGGTDKGAGVIDRIEPSDTKLLNNKNPEIIDDTRLYDSQNGFASDKEIENLLGGVGSKTGSGLFIGPRDDGNQTPPVPYTCKPGNITTDISCIYSYDVIVPRNCSYVVVQAWGGGGGAGFIPGKLVTGGGGAFAAAAFKNPYFNASSHSADGLFHMIPGRGACSGANSSACGQAGGTSVVNWRGGINNTVLIRAGAGGSGGWASGSYTAGKGGAGGQNGQNTIGAVGLATGGKKGTSNTIGLGGMNGDGYLIPNATDGKCNNVGGGVGNGGAWYPYGGGTGGQGGYCGGGEGGRSFNQSQGQGASAGGGGGGSFVNSSTIPGTTSVILPGNWEVPGYPNQQGLGNAGRGGTPANSGGKCGRIMVRWW